MLRFVIVIIIVIGLILWRKRSKRVVQENRLSKEKDKEDNRKSDEKRALRTEQKIRDQIEVRKHKAEVDEMELKAAGDRKTREEGLRRKIGDDKKRTAEEEERKRTEEERGK